MGGPTGTDWNRLPNPASTPQVPANRAAKQVLVRPRTRVAARYRFRATLDCCGLRRSSFGELAYTCDKRRERGVRRCITKEVPCAWLHTMPRCRNCETHVTEQFARVFGDNDNDVYNCTDCATNRDLYDGAGSAGSDVGDRAAAAWSQ